MCDSRQKIWMLQNSFFTKAFAWSFIDYGPEYTAFSAEGLDVGFFKSEQSSLTSNGTTLLVFYSNDLDYPLTKVEKSGGKIVRPIFSFPGGSRFHFTEPSGNAFAVWSDIAE